MSAYTQLGSGIPRGGGNGRIDDWDPKVRVSFLSPEELKAYQNGERGGRKMFTHDDYKRLKAEGKRNKEIAKIAKISIATLYNRLKVWGENLDEKPAVPKKASASAPAVAPVIRSSQMAPKESYSELIEDLKKMVRDKDGMIEDLQGTIKKYEDQLKQAKEAKPEPPKYNPQDVEEKIDQMESACADVENELSDLKVNYAALEKTLQEKEEDLKAANYNVLKKQDEVMILTRELSYAKENALNAKALVPHYQALLRAEWDAQRR